MAKLGQGGQGRVMWPTFGTVEVAQQAIRDGGFVQLNHLAYSPYLTPSN